MSDFSSYGPTFDMYLKPAFAAPGGSILSTEPIALGSWGVESGTSMATPFAAGSSALVLQAKGTGKTVVKGLRDLFQATASPVGSSNTDDDPLQTLAQQGAGLIQVNAAISTKTIVSPAQLLLNDTAHIKPMYVFHPFLLLMLTSCLSQTFTIKNTNTKSVTYKLTHVPAGTIGTLDPVRDLPVRSY